MIKVLHCSNKAQMSCRIHSDCEVLVKNFDKLKSGGVTDLFVEANEIRGIVQSLRISFRYIDRNLNARADDLAKQGLNRNSLVGGWVD